MGKRYIAIFCLMLLFLVACGENGDKSVSPNDEPVSEGNSSSSEKLSSSSVILSASKESSSSLAKSSSSSIQKNSSSSEKAKSSSSKDEKETKASSSSVKSSSSSSVIPGNAPESSSSSVKSSSSNAKSSSSSVEVPPTSSETESSSSSSEDKVNCSALLEGETDWSWDVPKECRFNPDIDYGTMTDERDGKVYKTVKIGDQTWMAENLNYADSVKTPSLKGKNWCYNKEPKNCEVAGRLYSWAAAIDSVKLANDADNPRDCGYGKICGLTGTVKGICPTGWHLPSQAKWSTLITAVGGQLTAGKVLKSQSGWNGTDAFGFAALPAGQRGNGSSFYNGDNSAYFWSSTEYAGGSAYGMNLYNTNEYYELQKNYNKGYGFSVRCLKD